MCLEDGSLSPNLDARLRSLVCRRLLVPRPFAVSFVVNAVPEDGALASVPRKPHHRGSSHPPKALVACFLRALHVRGCHRLGCRQMRQQEQRWVAELEQLKADNLALYERIKYVQDYQGEGDQTAAREAMRKYGRQYEENINPFTEFSRREKDRGFKVQYPSRRPGPASLLRRLGGRLGGVGGSIENGAH